MQHSTVLCGEGAVFRWKALYTQGFFELLCIFYDTGCSVAGEEAFISKSPCDRDAGKTGVFCGLYVYFRVTDIDSLLFRNGKVMKNVIKHVGRRLSMDGGRIAHDGVEKTGEMHRGELRYIRFVFV